MGRWHHASVFGSGERRPLDREGRAKWRGFLGLARRPGRVTLAADRIGRVLVAMLGRDGRLDPSHETLARLAHVHVSTVARGLDRLWQAGLLRWERRLVRRAATGWQTEQTSNAFVLVIPLPSPDTQNEARIPVGIKRKEEKGAREGQAGWASQVSNAARQLRALGFPVPDGWGGG